jgi:hypothetical protein
VSETMVGSAGLTVSALARRVVLAQTRCAIRRERSSSGRRVLFDDRVAVMSAARAPVAPLGFPPHELTAAIDLALFNARSQASLPVLNRLYRQPYAPGWAMRRCRRVQTRMASRPFSGPAC